MTLPVTISSPLPDGDLLFDSMVYRTGLSELGELRLQLASPRGEIKAEDLLGQGLTVAVALRDGGKRHIHGYVTRFGNQPDRGRHFGYSAMLRPWLWFLTRTSDCRIFQEMTVPDIVKKVFEDHEIADFDFRLVRSYRPWTYCVQYRESDFNFIARLLEHEGIYWFFEHQDGAHTLVLMDAGGSHHAAEGTEKLPFYASGETVPPDTDHVREWRFERRVCTGKVALTAYDFEKPSTSLLADFENPGPYKHADLELFDYAGDYCQRSDGKQYAEDRLDEQAIEYDTQGGISNAQGLLTGCTVTLERHPRADQNISYLVSSCVVQAHAHGNESGASAGFGDEDNWTCEFRTLPARQTFRPPRVTPKPFVQGPQTAVVVGPGGEEIFTDKYGRVKLQFHWDRYGKSNEKSSCWVRVASLWAGKQFGFVHVPRIGQEVVVDFLEGDPDQPLITGRVYNAEQMPPWDLPANATQSGVLTRSSKGGAYGNANAIRFEDKKGAEQLWIHAEKNQDIEVENDETHSVGHDRTKTIGHDETTHVRHDRTETVDNHETITIGVNRTESVGSNESITIGANRTESVGANESITIGANRSITVGASETATVALQRTHAVGVNESIAIGAAQEVVIGAMQSITVGANQSTSVGVNQSTSVGSNQSTEVGANRSIQVGGDQSTSVGKGRSTQVAKDDALKVGKNLVIDAGDAVTIKTGSASITMKKDGTIVIKGKDVTIDGSGKINIKASSDVVIKGSKVGVN
jgi:type VI secretion system secreted protein VgrG